MTARSPSLVMLAACLFLGCESRPVLLFMTDSGTVDAALPNATGTHVRAGEFHTCSLRAGAMRCWGAYTLAEYLEPAPPEEVHVAPVAVGGASDLVSLETGKGSSCALGTDGAVYCVGANINGQLGTGDTTPRDVLTLVSIVPSGSLSLTNFTGCAITVDGQLYCWGDNSESQLPATALPIVLRPQLAVPSQRFVEVSAGQGHVCAIDTGGGLWCWGRNERGECGVGLGVDRISGPTEVSPGRRWTHVSAGQNVTCAIAADRTLWCWGSGSDLSDSSPFPWDYYGVLSPFIGRSDPNIVRPASDCPGGSECFVVERPLQVGTANDWRTIDAATFHACGLRESGVSCWGRGQEGQLGAGDLDSITDPTYVAASLDVVEVSVGRFHTCVVDAAQRIHCTGKNEFGEVGVGDVTLRSSFTEVDLLE